MKIYFVRHGQTNHNILRIIAGQTVNVELTEEGKKQAEEAANQLPKDLAHIYSSPMLRCQQTMEIINKRFNLTVTFDERLRERHMGIWENKAWGEMPAETLKSVIGNKYDLRDTGGEDHLGVKDRLRNAINDILKDRKGENVLVVTHGGIIHALHDLLKKEAPEVIHNASIHEFEFSHKI